MHMAQLAHVGPSKSMYVKYGPKQHLDAMLHAVELPAGIAHLDSSLN